MLNVRLFHNCIKDYSLIQLNIYKSAQRSPLHRNGAGLRAMDAFVIKFMTESFYYFLRLAYKTEEEIWNGKRSAAATSELGNLLGGTLENRQTLPWFICSFVIQG